MTPGEAEGRSTELRKLPDAIESHPLAHEWAPALLGRYRRFAQVLAGPHALGITIGRGGVSFYATTVTGRTFACHFNAVPRRGRDDLGFADFRPKALAPQLDPDGVIADLQRRLGPGIELRAGKVWYGAHFSRERDDHVAHAFGRAVVDSLLAREG